MRILLKKGSITCGIVAIWCVGVAAGGPRYLPPERPQSAPPPPAPARRWLPPFQAQMLIRIAGPGKHHLEREMAITVGSTRMLIEPAKENIPGLLITVDPWKEPPGILLKEPPAILRWTGDKPPFHLPFNPPFEGAPAEKKQRFGEGLKGARQRIGVDETLDGRRVKRRIFETPFYKVTLWMDVEMKVPVKVVRESKGPLRIRNRKEIILKNLKPVTAEVADRHIAKALEGREEWMMEEWVTPGRVRRLLEAQGIPVTVGSLPARRVKMIHAGPRRQIRAFYGGKGLPHFFAVELTLGDVPAFIPDSNRPPVFSGFAGKWRTRIWSNLPPEATRREVQAYIGLLSNLTP